MLACLRLLALVTMGFLTLTFAVMTVVSRFRDLRRGSLVTAKTILISMTYAALTAVSMVLAIMLLDPTKANASLIGLVVILVGLALCTAIECFTVTLVDKGPRKMLSSIRSFLSHLCNPRNH